MQQKKVDVKMVFGMQLKRSYYLNKEIREEQHPIYLLERQQ